mmetsp:Transcript_22243/g.33394  ORF Transcript_22243/g.33394 Transcript_22243/m.33394 type:complete len:198 (-) Transcript_22243:46-639(-)
MDTTNMLYYYRLQIFAAFIILLRQIYCAETILQTSVEINRNEKKQLTHNMKNDKNEKDNDLPECKDYLPNEVWGYIERSEWIKAEYALSSDPSQARTIGYIHGKSRGTRLIADALCNSTSGVIENGEYPLPTSLRMEAPESLVLALLHGCENAAKISDAYVLTPLELALLHEYSNEVLYALYNASNMRSWALFLQDT